MAQSIKSEDNWVSVQKRTFTNWLNVNLTKMGHDTIEDLTEDCKDGIVLIKLLSGMTGAQIEHETDANTLYKRIANNNALLDFLKVNKCSLINIGSSDLSEGNEKLTLALVWIIILRFGVSGLAENVNMQALLMWCQLVTEGYKDVNIHNFTDSWSDGLAFNAIIHKFRPDLIGDFEELKKNSSEKNLESAFRIAEKFLEIPKLFEPTDIVDGVPDKTIVLPYVMQYYSFFSKLDQEEEKKRKICDAIRTINWAMKLENEYINKARAYLAMRNSFISENNKIEELKEAVNLLAITLEKTYKTRISLAQKLNMLRLELKGLAGDVNNVHSIFNLGEFVCPEIYAYSNLEGKIIESGMHELEGVEKLRSMVFTEDEKFKGDVKKIFDAFESGGPIEEQIYRVEKIQGIAEKIKLEEAKEIVAKKTECLYRLGGYIKNKDQVIKTATELFSQHDKKKQGKIGLTEGLSLLKKFNGNITGPIEKAIRENSQGTITFDEFISCVSRFETIKQFKELKNEIEEGGSKSIVNVGELGLEGQDVDLIADDNGNIDLNGLFEKLGC